VYEYVISKFSPEVISLVLGQQGRLRKEGGAWRREGSRQERKFRGVERNTHSLTEIFGNMSEATEQGQCLYWQLSCLGADYFGPRFHWPLNQSNGEHNGTMKNRCVKSFS
jgi:hypothetical protein